MAHKVDAGSTGWQDIKKFQKKIDKQPGVWPMIVLLGGGVGFYLFTTMRKGGSFDISHGDQQRHAEEEEEDTLNTKGRLMSDDAEKILHKGQYKDQQDKDDASNTASSQLAARKGPPKK